MSGNHERNGRLAAVRPRKRQDLFDGESLLMTGAGDEIRLKKLLKQAVGRDDAPQHLIDSIKESIRLRGPRC